MHGNVKFRDAFDESLFDASCLRPQADGQTGKHVVKRASIPPA